MLGLYISRPSPIHRLPASSKLLLLACAGIGLFWLHSVGALLLGLGLVLGSAAAARLPPRQVTKQLRPILPVLLGIWLLHGWATTWETGTIVVLRFGVLVLLATVVSLTTRVSAMMAVLERSLRPFEFVLKRAGLSVSTVTLMLVLTIRFIPVLLTQLQEIQAAQQARGVSRPALTLWMPLLLKTLRLADQVTEALDARGYGDN
ncbi:MAG: energy-coupling factor transporter transmembrane component T family protein [Elainellaceae cyanobacterium]